MSDTPWTVNLSDLIARASEDVADISALYQRPAPPTIEEILATMDEVRQTPPLAEVRMTRDELAQVKASLDRQHPEGEALVRRIEAAEVFGFSMGTPVIIVDDPEDSDVRRWRVEWSSDPRRPFA